MSYNTELQSNNEDLRSILNKINSLPDIDESGDGGIQLPDLGDNEAKSYEVALNKKLIDSNGEIVTGTLSEHTSGGSITATGEAALLSDPGVTKFRIGSVYSPNNSGDNTKGCIIRPGVTIESTNIPTRLFGDAMPEQVAKGVTFTSKAGLLIPGEMEINQGVELPELNPPGSEDHLLEGVQLIGQDGRVVDGKIPKKTASDITVSGAMMTVPAGYYENQSLHSVSMASLASPSISEVDDSGKITASVTQTAGYVDAGTKETTRQLSTQAAENYTPGAYDLVIPSGKYLTGDQTIKGDINLKSSNIIKGASIFGIDGSAGVSASDLSDIGELYFWEKYNGDPTKEYCEEEVSGVSFLVSSKVGVSTKTYRIFYSDTYSYDPDTKQFSLGSSGYCSTISDARANLPGKYIRYNTTYDTIYLVSDTATFTETTSSYVGTSKSILISDAVKYSANKMLGYVASDDNSTYPNNGEHTDNRWYIYGGLLSDAIEDEHADSGTPESPEINEVEQATPSISINSSGLVTASATQEEGYVAEGTKTSEMQLKTLSSQIITPGQTDQKIEAGVYVIGTQTIKGDENLKSENIKEGVSIYGFDGTYKATAASITVDSELLANSTNPIQNKAVYNAINAINKSTNITTYTDPSQFGCTFASTITEVCSAAPSNSIFMCNAGGFTDQSWNLPSTYGTIVFFKHANTRKRLDFYGKSLAIGDYQMNFDDKSGNPTGVWTMSLSSVLHSSMYGTKLPGEDGKPYTHTPGRLFFLKASD